MGDLKAAYRLLSEPDVTHRALSQPHWRATRQQAASLGDQVVLFVQDRSALDFTTHNRTTGLGPIGDTRGKGLIMHSCLAVRPGADQAEVIGLAAQQVWCRRLEVYRGHESRARRAKRRTEADAWGEVVEEIGEVPSGVRWVSVGDRASDIFSDLRRAQAKGWDCSLRVAQDRVIRTAAGERLRLLGWARGLPRKGVRRSLYVAATECRSALPS